MIDVVYALGKGSRWQDNELRYSLRSIEKYLQCYRNVYIVGELPDWLQNVTHIPYPMAASYVFKEKNIYDKIQAACDHPEVSDDFIFFNDDHFLLKPLVAAEIPYYYKGSLYDAYSRREAQDAYYSSLKQSFDLLFAAGLGTSNFDIHCPIVYNKEYFTAALKPLNWKKHFSYVVKSMYCNCCHIPGEYLKDMKMNAPLKMLEIEAALSGLTFFSCGDRGLQGDLPKWLQTKFPNKSKYEK